MLARRSIPWAGKSHGDTAGVSGKGLNGAGLTRASDALTKDAEETPSAVDAPDSHDGVEVLELAEVEEMKVEPDTDDGKSCEGDVQELESLVECVPDGAPGLNAQGNEGTSCLCKMLALLVTLCRMVSEGNVR